MPPMPQLPSGSHCMPSVQPAGAVQQQVRPVVLDPRRLRHQLRAEQTYAVQDTAGQQAGVEPGQAGGGGVQVDRRASRRPATAGCSPRPGRSPPAGLPIARARSEPGSPSARAGHSGSPYAGPAQRRWSAAASPKPRSSRHGPAISSARNRPTDRPSTRRTSSPTRCPYVQACSPATVPGVHSGSAAARSAESSVPVGDRGGRPGHREGRQPGGVRQHLAHGGGVRNSGQYRVTGASRSTVPRSTSSSRQSAATGLPTE